MPERSNKRIAEPHSFRTTSDSNGRRASSDVRIARPSKLQHVCAQLTDLAHRLGPQAKFPTVLEMRDSLGVSVATLNTALGELEARNIVERRHGIGIYVSRDLHRRSIYLICEPSFYHVAGVSPFWGMLIGQSWNRAAAHQEDFSLHFALARDPNLPAPATPSGLHESLAQQIRERRMDGIIGVGLLQETANFIADEGIPFVAFAGAAPVVVTLAGEQGMNLAVSALQERGCKQIGFWCACAPYRILSFPLPLELSGTCLFREAMSRHGLIYHPALVREWTQNISPQTGIVTETQTEQGYLTALSVFGPGSDPALRPDGIYIADDIFAQGAMMAFQNLGIRVPEDIVIVSQSNKGSSVLMGWEERLIRIEVDPQQIVEGLFDQLETLMEGKPVSTPDLAISYTLRLPESPQGFQ